MNITNFSKKEEIFFILLTKPLKIGENWYEIGPKTAGGNYIYSDKAVILIHIITHLFRIDLRQTVWFIEGYLQQIGKILKNITKNTFS